MLFEEPGGELLGQGTGPCLALIEGDQLRLLVGIEQQFKDRFGLLEPLLAETVARRGTATHGSPSWGKARPVETQLAILPGRRSCKNGNGPCEVGRTAYAPLLLLIVRAAQANARERVACLRQLLLASYSPSC